MATAEELTGNLATLKKALKEVGVPHGLEWMDTLTELVNHHFDSVGLKKGDKVRLKETHRFPQIHADSGREHGWWHARYTFIAGAVGEVVSVDFVAYGLRYTSVGIKFAREVHTWNHPAPRQFMLIDRHGVFGMNPAKFEVITEQEYQAAVKLWDDRNPVKYEDSGHGLQYTVLPKVLLNKPIGLDE